MGGMQETRRFNSAPDIFGGVEAALYLGAGQQYAKFVSPAPENEIGHPDRVPQDSRQGDESFVSGEMSVQVIDVFEIIDVNQHQRERDLVPLGSCHFSDDDFIEESRVVQPCQCISICSFLQ